MDDIALISTRSDGKTVSIPDWFCTCENPMLYNNQHNPPALPQFSPRGNNRDRQFQVKFKIIATAFSSAFYAFVIKNNDFEQQVGKFHWLVLIKDSHK